MSGRGALGLLVAYASSDSEEGSVDLSNSTINVIQPTVAAILRPRPPSKRTLERIERREERKINRRPIFKNCGCKSLCCGKIGRERRVQINTWFWELSGTEQQSFVLQFSKRIPVERRRSPNIRRQFSYKYMLEDERGVPQDVCCAFFLNTLGYNKKSRFVVFSINSNVQ